MIKVNTKNCVQISNFPTREVRKLILEYKNTFTQEQPKIDIAAAVTPEIREEMLKTVQRKLKGKILEYFVPYIEKNAQIAAGQKGVSIKDYTQNLYLKFLECLESIAKSEKFHLTQLYKPIRNIDRTEEDYVCTEHCSPDCITPQEELENSCGIGDVTYMQKAQAIIEILKKILTPEEFNIFSLRADNNSCKQIGEIVNKEPKQIENILYKTRKKTNTDDVKPILDELLYNNNYTTEELTALAESWHKPKKNPIIFSFNPDEIWETVEKNRGRLDVRKELDTMLKTQTSSKELLNNVSSQTKMMKKLEKNPDYKLTLKLDRKCNNARFIKEAGLISIRLFGKNIFEFTE